MLEVHAVDDGGWAIVGGAKAETFDTLDEALAVYLETCGSVPKSAKLRDADSRELNGAWRWLPACEQEPEAIKGARIDGEALREAAVSLNTRATPVVIDGGPTPPGMLPSEVHGTPMTGGNTLANGWAHTAAILVDRSGNVELYLWAEVVPVVAREIDAGRMGGGSVDLRYKTLEGDAPRGVSLGSFALTNDPAVTTLDPANAPRARADGLHSAVRYGRFEGRVLRATSITRSQVTRATDPAVGARVYVDPATAHMPEAAGLGTVEIVGSSALGIRFDSEPEQIHRWYVADELSAPPAKGSQKMAKPTKSAVRGPAMDAEAKIFALFGIDPTDEDADYQLSNAIWAIRQQADSEEAIAAVMGGKPLEAPEASGAAAASASPAPAVAMASAAFRASMAALAPFIVARDAKGLASALRDAAAPMTPEQSTALLGQIVTVLAQVFDKPDASPAELFDLLNASADKIKGALAATAEPPKGDAPKDGSGTGQPPPVQASAETRANTTADLVGLRSRAETAEAKAATLEQRLAALEALETRRTLADSIDAAFRGAQRALSPEGRDELVAEIMHLPETMRAAPIARAVKAAGGSPITSDVMGKPSQASRSGAQTGGTAANGATAPSADELVRVARTEFLPALRAANAALPRHKQQPAHELVAASQRAATAKYPHLAVRRDEETDAA